MQADFSETSLVSVSALALYLREILEVNDVLNNIWVHGEVSNCKTYPSGHCYFTLKEGESQLHCVFFKFARLRSDAPTLENGMAIALNGRISFYERDGKLQCYVESVTLRGTGMLFQRFEQLKTRLAAEGLFDEARKRPLPERPRCIGLVTSPQASVLRDMVRVMRSQYPLARVILSPAQVQGDDAPASLVAALERLHLHGEADIIIVARGGGSLEELWAFNDERVARAIARSPIPVISGVGHETDTTLSDFVADLRASTPTAAATLAVPHLDDYRENLTATIAELEELLQDYLEDQRSQLTDLQRELQRNSPQSTLDRFRQQLDDLGERLQTQTAHRLLIERERLRGTIAQLHTLSPLVTLTRGYAHVSQLESGETISSVHQAQIGDRLQIQLQDGILTVQTQGMMENADARPQL